MSDPTPELSSVAAQLDTLVERITAVAERCELARDETLAVELYEVERSLSRGARRLHALLRHR